MKAPGWILLAALFVYGLAAFAPRWAQPLLVALGVLCLMLLIGAAWEWWRARP